MAAAMEFCTVPMANSSVDFLVSNKRMASRSSSTVGFGSFGLGVQSKGVVVLRRNLVRCEAVEETNRSVEAFSSSSSSISILEQLKTSGADRYTREKSSLVVIGLSVHTAPVEMREKLSIPEAQWFQAIEDLCDLNHIEEAAVLSTCNRMEIYFVALSWHRGIREVTEWMSKISGIPVSELRSHLFLLRDNDATHHLFEVAAGLDSLVLGEGQILSQVKQVIRIGQANGGLGKNIDRLFKDAITAGKRVRSETSISSGAVSVSSAAVELALTKLPATHRSSARMLVVGAGKMGKLVIKHLVAKGCNKIVVMNRSSARVSSIQEEFNNVDIIYKPFSEMLSCAAEADVIFTSTASETALFLKEHVEALPPPNPEIGDPRLTDYDTLLDNIHGLKQGNSVQVPVYDFKTSRRTDYRTVDVPSSRIVIIEGIYALSERLRPDLDLRVSVTGGVHFDLVKRVLRDIQRASQEPEEIIHQISETVYPMYKAFIEPGLQTAHIKIINKFNPFTGFQNPTYILKSRRMLTTDEIKAVVSKEHTETMEETYDIYLLPPGEDPEACQSYLRMRNRDGKYNLMFEEWVTDSPFIISPRITFEVSVRLLGGLMALGYTIAAILKRSSHAFHGERVTVKIDWLEQLNRHYVQVQGRDRAVVKQVAKDLGLDGSYIPRTYIEQIQLEKLVNEVMTLPDDLRSKLSIDEELVSSPREALSRASADRMSLRNKNHNRAMSRSFSTRGDATRLTGRALPNNRALELPPAINQGVFTQLSEQISTLNERMDEFINRIEELNSKLSFRKSSVSSTSQPNLALYGIGGNGGDICCNGNVGGGSGATSLFLSGLGNGTLLHSSSSSSQLAKESSMVEEMGSIARGQRQIVHQLDNLSSLVHEQSGGREKRGRGGKGRIMEMDLTGSPLILLLAVSVVGLFLWKDLGKS